MNEMAYCMNCRSHDVRVHRHRLVCKDGVSLSVQVGESLYCTPRNDVGPWSAVEVGYVQDAEGNPFPMPQTWWEYADSFEGSGEFSTVYAWVPVDVLEAFVAEHGGRQFYT